MKMASSLVRSLTTMLSVLTVNAMSYVSWSVLLEETFSLGMKRISFGHHRHAWPSMCFGTSSLVKVSLDPCRCHSVPLCEKYRSIAIFCGAHSFVLRRPSTQT